MNNNNEAVTNETAAVVSRAYEINTLTISVVREAITAGMVPHDKVADMIRSVNKAIAESFVAGGAIETALEGLTASTAVNLLSAPMEGEVSAEVEEVADEQPQKYTSVFADPYDAIEDEQIRCLIDGVGRKMLKRYLRQKYNLEWEQYLEAFGLPADYPSVAPKYSDSKRQEALDIGLGSVVPKTPRALRAVEAAPAAQTPSTATRRRRQRDAATSGTIPASRVAA